MKLLEKINSSIHAPVLTRTRVVAAMTIAVVVDVLQLSQIPVFEEILDVIAMVSIAWLIGFHVLLLPTFALEFVPFIDAIPFWTGCTAAVIALRRPRQNAAVIKGPPPPELPTKPS